MELLQDLAGGLDLVPVGLDLLQIGQAEQLVEAAQQAQMGEAVAQVVADGAPRERGHLRGAKSGVEEHGDQRPVADVRGPRPTAAA